MYLVPRKIVFLLGNFKCNKHYKTTFLISSVAGISSFLAVLYIHFMLFFKPPNQKAGLFMGSELKLKGPLLTPNFR